MEKILEKLKEMHGVKHGWGEQESELLSKLNSPELVGRMHSESIEKAKMENDANKKTTDSFNHTDTAKI